MAYDKAPSSKRARTGKRIAVSVYLDPTSYDQLVKLATKNDRPVAAELRQALRTHLAKVAA